MTWTLATTTGVGGSGIEYRLVIEGCEIEPCTDGLRMRGDCTESGHVGKRRVGGLQREGLGFSERAYLAGAEIDVTVNTIRVAETPYPDLDAATSVFSKLPDVKAWLTASLTASGVTATVGNNTNITNGDFLHIGTEVVEVTAKPTGTTCTIVRGRWGTTGQAHNVTTGGVGSTIRSLENGIGVWRGRRVWLYAHGATELAVGDTGTLVMRGRLTAEPELDASGTSWALSVGSMWEVLDSDARAADRARGLRGAYYPNALSLVLEVWRLATSSAGSAGSDLVTIRVPGGFYATNAEFASTVAATLNANATISGWGVVFSGREAPDGTWDLGIRSQAASPRFIAVVAISPVDGGFLGNRVKFAAATTGRVEEGELLLENFLASVDYIYAWAPVTDGPLPPESQRRIPRTINTLAARSPRYSHATDLSTGFPLGRLYLSDMNGVAVDDYLIIQRPNTADGDSQPPQVVRVFSVSTGSGYVEAYGETTAGVSSVEVPPEVIAAGSSVPEITVAKGYSTTLGTDLEGFRDGLIAAAAGGANDGSTPFILSGDVADWGTAVTEAAAGRPYLTTRVYIFHKAQRISEVLREEAKLLGCYFYLDADFKIALRRLTLETEETASLYVIGNKKQLVGSGYGSIEAGADGHVNAVEISRGYDPIEDEYTDRPIHVVDKAAIARAKRDAVITIRPKVAPAATGVGSEIDEPQAEQLTRPIRALFGGKILHAKVRVPLTAWSVLVGDSVLLNIEELPFDGHRTVHDPGLGMVNQRAMVVAREWDFESGTGTFTCLLTGLDVAGYAPTGRIASQAGATTTWTLTLTATYYAASGATDASYFTAGDEIRIVEWNVETPTVRTGNVTSVSGNDVGVELDASWTPGASTWNLCFATNPTAAQREYAYIADSGHLRSDDSLAQVFAP